MSLSRLDNSEALAHYEQVIERGLKTFFEVGQALFAIRNQRLYQETHDTFEAYCLDRWGIQRRRAYQLIDASIVVENVKNFSHPPQIESHAAPLAQLEPEQQSQAWERAVKTAPNGKVTAAHVSRVADEYKPKPQTNGHPPSPSQIGDEYYTPQYIIDATREVMGGIDLDPAGCALANQVVQADRFYTKLNNGLIRPWSGRVFLNPPFSFPRPFIDRLIAEYDAGQITEAITLVNNGTETSWGQALLTRFPVCFFSNRISFWHQDPDRPIVGNRYAQMVFYLGGNAGSFREFFTPYGAIMEPSDV